MKKDKQQHKGPAASPHASTREKPTTPSGDALDDTGEDNQRRKPSKGNAKTRPHAQQGRIK